MLMIFTLGRVDVLPVDDLGIKKGIQKAYRLREMPKKEKIEGTCQELASLLFCCILVPLETQG